MKNVKIVFNEAEVACHRRGTPGAGDMSADAIGRCVRANPKCRAVHQPRADPSMIGIYWPPNNLHDSRENLF